MKCDRVLELLSDYIDGELSPAGALGIQSHLRRCAACASEHQALRRTVQMVALYGRQQSPIDCREAVMARLRSETAPRWPGSRLSLAAFWRFGMPAAPAWARATALAGLAAVSIGAGTYLFSASRAPLAPWPAPTTRMVASALPGTRLVQDDHARMRESYQLLQALGRDDGYILAADVVDEKP